MRLLSSSLRMALSAVLPLALVGCVVEEHHYDDPPVARPPSGHVGGDGSDDPSSGGSSSGGTSTPQSPMLVVVDTDQVMNANPGQGVGIFVEYRAGGTWHVWWTCDTSLTGQDCDFNVDLKANSGVIRSVDSSALTGGYVATPSAEHIVATSRTSTDVHGVTFATDAGAIVTLEATVSGIKDSSFLFFVQDGQVNGGFNGNLTNPLQFQGNRP